MNRFGRPLSFGRFVLILTTVSLAAAVILSGCLNRATDEEDRLVDKFESEPTISLYVNETGETKQIKLEEYIAGVVAGEMLPDWPVNAYAAQAILARTFTLAKMSAGGMRQEYGTDMSTDRDETQAYNAGAVTDAIRQAVASTRGLIVTYKGRYIKGWFHAASGGETTLAKDGLAYKGAEPPYTERVKVPTELEYIPNDQLNWSAEFSLAEVQNALATLGQSVGTVRNVTITKKDPSGRAVQITVEGDSGKTAVHGADFRTAIGPDRMKSTLLTSFSVSGGSLAMAGKGFGHGVGMSQWGAYGMAKQGKSPQEIVTSFFRGVEVTKLWD